MTSNTSKSQQQERGLAGSHLLSSSIFLFAMILPLANWGYRPGTLMLPVHQVRQVRL